MWKLCLCLLAIFQSSSVRGDPSVIIVGAGPAGLAAAVKLLENSITNITIIEAEDRIGGRVKSVEFGGGIVDEGAQYCHGEEGNTVYQTVKDLDLLEHSHVIDLETDKLYYSNGSAIEHELAYELNNIITSYSDEVDRSSSNQLAGEFLAFYNTTVLDKYSTDAEKLKIVTDALKFANDLILMHEGSFSWETPAAGRHYKAATGDQMMTWKSGGYQSFLNVLLKKYPDSSQAIPIEDYIVLNTTVEKITWNDTKVKVKTSANTELEADHVIFTASVGVLQADKDTLFDPQLPQRKQEAIEALGLDAILKIILHFPDIWWSSDDKVFYFVWSSEDLANLQNEFTDGPNNGEWVSHIVALVAVPDNPNVLTVWVSGDLIPEIEQTSEDIVGKGAMFVLRKFLGTDYNVTDPDEILRTQWYTNPKFRGAFSYEKAEYFDVDVSYQERLGEPVLNAEDVPTLLFAGESTNPTLYSTVHGAVDTGRREAERIINLYNSGNSISPRSLCSVLLLALLIFFW